MKNAEQKLAIEYDAGPLLIIAGAGTGKTHVIVEKIKYLINKNLAEPGQILALTFTDKAATEMETRVDEAMPYGYFQMSIFTFHAFADMVLKEESSAIGINPGAKLMTEAETIIFLRQNLFLLDLHYFRPLSNPNKFLQALLQHFSRLRDEDISPEDYIKWTKNKNREWKMENGEEKIEAEKYIELANAYKTYQQLKIKEGVFDFADLVFYLLQLFRQRPNLLKNYQKKFSHILVDEFQDTNIAQYELIKLLCPAKKNPHLTLVGDDSQAIYKFRGASVSNIINFRHDYPKAHFVTLRKNYRSNQTILDAAYKLIRHNDPDTLEAKLNISKNLIAQKPDIKDAIKFNLTQSVEEEAEYVSGEILKLRKIYAFSDIAILVRANNHSDAFIRSFSRRGIPYQFLGPGMLFKQPEVKDLIAYLKTLYNLEDSVSLFRVLSMQIFQIDSLDLTLLSTFAKKINLFLFQSIKIYLSFFNKEIYQPEFEIYKKYLPLLNPETREKLLPLYKMIKRHVALVKKETAGQILYYFLVDSKYLNRLVVYKTEKDEKIALNISKFFNKLKTFESEHEDAGVSAVVDYIEMSMELGESPIVAETDINLYNAVNILTVHSAKGLEFPVVFLVNLTKGRFPTNERRESIPIPDDLIKETLQQGDYHEQEERRLFYVGLTRACDKIFLTASKFYGEGKREQRISRFVEETIQEDIFKKYLSLKKDEKAQLSIFDFKKVEEPILKNKIQLNNFSYTQLETYRRCPLQYKYQFIIKVPTTPLSSASFGETIHKTLQQFYSQYLKKRSIGKKELLEIYEKNWIPLGYASRNHEVRMKKEGREMLKNYLKTFHKTNLKIIGLEKLFKIKISSDLFLTGKIDRVDNLGGEVIEIIDYKTGKVPNERELKKNLQLSIYALAASSPGLYRKKLADVNLTFYYLQNMKKISLKKTSEDLKNVEDEIKKIADEIRKSDFSPKVGPWCDFCSFRMICEAWQ